MMIVPPVTNERFSPAALERAQRLTSVIQEFRVSRPGLETRDLRQAIRITQTAAGMVDRRRTALVLALALLILGQFAGLFFAGR